MPRPQDASSDAENPAACFWRNLDPFSSYTIGPEKMMIDDRSELAY
jgi:hypothetical protein